MTIEGKIEVLFVAGFGPIVREMTASRKLYSEALGIRFWDPGTYSADTVLLGWRSKIPGQREHGLERPIATVH